MCISPLSDGLLCRQNSKIALLTDNATTHAVPDHEVEKEHGIKFNQLSDIKLIFLPPKRCAAP
jgi:hypothetical protein